MTAVNWLIEELKKVHHPTEAMIMYAKKLEKQQIIDAYGDGLNAYRTDFCNRDEYFAKTYGSKGSDVTSSQTDENGKPLTYWGGLDTSSPTTSDKWKEYQDWLNEVPEISDEEIEKAARDYDNAVIYGPPLLHFEQGAFWYREKLKSGATQEK